MRGLFKVIIHVVALTALIIVVGYVVVIIVLISLDARHYPEKAEDWQVYRNEKYGFEISYPRKYRAHSLFPDIATITSVERDFEYDTSLYYREISFVENGIVGQKFIDIDLYSSENPNMRSLDDFRDYLCDAKVHDDTNWSECTFLDFNVLFNLHGYDGVYFIVTHHVFAEGKEHISRWKDLIIERPTADGVLYYEINQLSLSDEIYEQIIKSFKFIE